MKKTTDASYRGLPINASAQHGHECYVQILQTIHDQLNALLSYHSRITIVRLDLHLPNSLDIDHRNEGKLLSLYIKQIKRLLSSSNWNIRGKFIHGYVKEIGDNKKSHFHLYLGFQTLYKNLGHINTTGHTGVWKELNNTWIRLSGGTAHIVPKVHTIDRSNSKALEPCFYHLSYLAKTRTKHFNTGETYKRYCSSRLKPKKGHSSSLTSAPFETLYSETKLNTLSEWIE